MARIRQRFRVTAFLSRVEDAARLRRPPADLLAATTNPALSIVCVRARAVVHTRVPASVLAYSRTHMWWCHGNQTTGVAERSHRGVMVQSSAGYVAVLDPYKWRRVHPSRHLRHAGQPRNVQATVSARQAQADLRNRSRSRAAHGPCRTVLLRGERRDVSAPLEYLSAGVLPSTVPASFNSMYVSRSGAVRGCYRLYTHMVTCATLLSKLQKHNLQALPKDVFANWPSSGVSS